MRTFARWWPVGLIAVLCVGLVVGCGAKKETSKGEEFVVGFANSSLNHPWRIAIQDAILNEAKKYPDIKVVCTEAKEQSAKQVNDVEDLLSRGVDLVMVCTVEGEPFAPAVESVKRAGVPLVPVDRAIVGPDYTCFVGQSNKDIGRNAADYIASHLLKKYGKATGRVVELQGTPGNVPTEHRKEGFHARMAEKYPQIKIIASQNTDYTRASALRVMENILQGQKEIDAIYTHEDEIALGAIEALKASKRLGGVVITGCGGSKAALESIRKGEMTACATYSPIDAGTIGMRASAKILHGEDVPKDIPLFGTMIDKANIDKFHKPGMVYVYTVDLDSKELPAK